GGTRRRRPRLIFRAELNATLCSRTRQSSGNATEFNAARHSRFTRVRPTADREDAMFPRTMPLPLLLGAAVASSVPVAADACFIRSPQPMHVSLDHVQVDVTDGVAVKSYNCTFKNPNPQAVVGATCYMELEPGAQVDDMSVWVDGKQTR